MNFDSQFLNEDELFISQFKIMVDMNETIIFNIRKETHSKRKKLEILQVLDLLPDYLKMSQNG